MLLLQEFKICLWTRKSVEFRKYPAGCVSVSMFQKYNWQDFTFTGSCTDFQIKGVGSGNLDEAQTLFTHCFTCHFNTYDHTVTKLLFIWSLSHKQFINMIHCGYFHYRLTYWFFLITRIQSLNVLCLINSWDVQFTATDAETNAVESFSLDGLINQSTNH